MRFLILIATSRCETRAISFNTNNLSGAGEARVALQQSGYDVVEAICHIDLGDQPSIGLIN